MFTKYFKFLDKVGVYCTLGSSMSFVAVICHLHCFHRITDANPLVMVLNTCSLVHITLYKHVTFLTEESESDPKHIMF